MTLALTATDAIGNFWFEKEYSMQTGISSYAEYRDRTQDPYQKVFNDFANDLHAYVLTLDPKQIARIREVSELKFFADMAPNVSFIEEWKEGPAREAARADVLAFLKANS